MKILFCALLFSASAVADAKLATINGRYVFAQISNMRRDQYLLDTQTGKLWRVVCIEEDPKTPSECGRSVMMPVEFTDQKGNLRSSP